MCISVSARNFNVMNFSHDRNPQAATGDVKSVPGIFMRIVVDWGRWVALGLCLAAVKAGANPTGMTVQSGSATATGSGSQLTVSTSQNAFLNWQTFNIGSGETTVFNQPSSTSIVVNNIHDANASQIYGSLQANGLVVLMNRNGFYFGPDSFISTGGLIVSTANCVPPQNAGGNWEFNGPPPIASIVNYGRIDVGQNGSAFLIADRVENRGEISAPGGSIGLASGQTVLLSERPDGRGMSMEVTLPGGSVNNSGKLIADGGTIALNAKVVNQTGFIQANTVHDENGVIELVADSSLALGSSSRIRADGGNGVGDGGTVTLRSGGDFSDATGSQVSANGGQQGGNGGSIEVSAPHMVSLDTTLNASAHPGWTAGQLLLDPDYIVLGDTSSGSAANTLYLDISSAFSGFSKVTLEANKDITVADGIAWDLSGSTGQSSGELALEAGRNIIFGDGASIIDSQNWSVALYAGVSVFSLPTLTTPASPTMQAGVGTIYLGGFDGTTALGLNGNIQTASGTVNLVAGQDILVGSGYVVTTAGGDINAHALAGSIDTGSYAQGYHFVSNVHSLNAAYTMQFGLGGISTEAGGDVTLVAGQDVRSVLPGRGSYYYAGNPITADTSHGPDYLTAGSGAYGHQAGNVTIVAGGNVTGNYLVANGTGSIFAGVQMVNGIPVIDGSGHYLLNATGNAGLDLATEGLSLNLISGGWNVVAGNNILLQEVRNPNGVFDSTGGAAYNHYFDYSPGSYVNLAAGNLVQLGTAIPLPRLTGVANNLPVIYPSVLNITAGDGGIIFGAPSSSSPTSLILFPSAQGGLTINTSGSLISQLNAIQGQPQLFNLIVSDSASHQYTSSSSFGLADHGSTPIHADNPTPIDVNVGGDMNLVFLAAPESAQINVAGNMINCGFQGMNLSAGAPFQATITEADGSTRNVTVDPGATRIHVGGEIFNRGDFTSIDLSQVIGAAIPDFSVFARAIDNTIGTTAISPTTLTTSFYFDPATHVLTYQNIPNVTIVQIMNLLQNLKVQKVDSHGNLLWLDAEQTIPNTQIVSVLNSADAAALIARFNALGAVPATANGYILGGGGLFDVTANTINLGTSAGIQSLGVGLYSVHSTYPLAGLFGDGGVFARGADLSVTTTGDHGQGLTPFGDQAGDVDMFSSSIASLNGGNVSVSSSADLNAGSSTFTVNTLAVRGIYTTSGGDVSVTALGDINVNGSRIGTYDGGDVTVESLTGDINAGRGVSSPVSVPAYYEDPVTHTVYVTAPQIVFSGIFALTFPNRDVNYPAPIADLGNILVEAPYGDITANVSGILQLPLNHRDYPNAVTAVLAGYELRDASGHRLDAGDLTGPTAIVQATSEKPPTSADPAHTVIVNGDTIQVSAAAWAELLALLGFAPDDNSVIALSVTGDPLAFETALGGDGAGLLDFDYIGRVSNDHDINALGSGIIASNAKLDASGNISGLIFARNNIDVSAQQNVNVTALGLGSVNVSSSGGSISGTIIGVGGVTASSDSIDASLVSANVTGATSGQSGLGLGAAANSTSQAAASEDSDKVAAAGDKKEDDTNKKEKQIVLARKSGRVTVLLPPKNVTETQTTHPAL